MFQLFVSSTENWEGPEVEVSGSAASMSKLGRIIKQLEGRQEIETCLEDDEFYPVSIPKLVVERVNDESDRLTVKVEESTLSLSGNAIALENLGDSLINFFNDDASIGEHFQLFYYEGNRELNKTSCELTFACDR